MQTILTLTPTDFDAPLSDIEPERFTLRRTARAVLLDAVNQAALLYVGTGGFHKLPGGGVENGETIEDALYREVLEETGCRGDIIRPIGRVIERRDEIQQLQESDCYLMRVRGDKGEPAFDKMEHEQQCQVHWFGSIDAAINQIQSEDEPATMIGKMVVTRELFVLNRAKELVSG